MTKKGKRISPGSKMKEASIVKRRGKPAIVLNVDASLNQESDYQSSTLGHDGHFPLAFDTRDLVFAQWGNPFNQGQTGSCVGQAMSKLLQHHLYRAKKLRNRHSRYAPSRKYLWQAPKEIDIYETRPTTMINTAGTYIKTSLDIARKFGAPTERVLPMDSEGTMKNEGEFYSLASSYKIKAYFATSPYGQGYHFEDYQKWLINEGPMIVRLWVDVNFIHANRRTNYLDKFNAQSTYGYHAALIVAYRIHPSRGIEYLLLNSWGTRWGSNGLVWMSENYVKQSIGESYGIQV